MFSWKRRVATSEIKFFATEEQLSAFPHPRPAQKILPEYFARMKPQSSAHPKSGTVKRCVPFLEAASAGFIIPLWADCLVTARDNNLHIEFSENLPMETSLSPHGFEQIRGHPLEKKPYGNIPVKWHNPWGIETAKGWSVLITSPLNHLEARFKILDGVVDTDTYYNQVNFPFLWTGGDGEFFIKRGTPLAQVIPFQRTDCHHSVVVEDTIRRKKTNAMLGTLMRHGYRSLFWHKAKHKE